MRWTCKSTHHLAEELTQQGHPASARSVAQLLKAAGYSLQGNRKTKELVGQFKNGGREWEPKGEPETVEIHDCGNYPTGIKVSDEELARLT